MSVLKEDQKRIVQDLFEKQLRGEVRVVVFTRESKECEYCSDTKELLTDISELSPKIKLEIHDLDAERELAQQLGVDKAPATVLISPKGSKLYFFGIPSGYEFKSLLEDLIDVSTNSTRLSESTKSKVKSIAKPVSIKVFVTPMCPYCPSAVRTAHQFSLENPMIRAEMIEAMEFSDMAQKYSVMAVPKIVVNDSVEFEGAVPENLFAERILSALSQG